MGHFGKFCSTLWATVVNLVMRYRPLCQIWLCAVGHCGGFGYTLWATVQNEAVLQKSNDFSAMDHVARFGYAKYGP